MSVASKKSKRTSVPAHLTSVNPANGELIAEYAIISDQQITERIERAADAFENWRDTPLSDRCELFSRLADALRSDVERLAGIATEEMGKPISQSRGEIEKCAWVCDYYAKRALDFLASRQVETDAEKSYVRFDPLGVVFAIMPWNFPYWQVFRFAAPTLVAGNVGLLKHASDVTGVALAIEELFLDAGFPPSVFTSLVISKDQSEQVIAHPAIRAVTLTGSEGAGRSVAAQAGREIKKCVLELGGSDPFLVLNDADIALAAEKGILARTQNAGQSCIAAKRFIVTEGVADEFVEAFVAEMQALVVGDPREDQTDVGPLARRALVDTLHEQVLKSVDQGARLLWGGKPIDPYGCYYAPTVLDHVQPGMTVFDEETFGPVAAIVRADDLDSAITLANHSTFGLGASIWTRDIAQAEQVASRIEAGCISINDIVKSDPRLPFGGVKHSGYGRELSEFGIHEFVNVKSVNIEL